MIMAGGNSNSFHRTSLLEDKFALCHIEADRAELLEKRLTEHTIQVAMFAHRLQSIEAIAHVTLIHDI